MPPLDPLDLIEQKESRGQNVPNYKYGPGFSASGHYQIIDETWRRWAKAAGIDVSQYPTAMSAPREVQRAVAKQGYDTEGFRPWKAVENLVGQEGNYGAAGSGVLSAQGTAASPVATAARNIEELKARILAAYPQAVFTSEYRSPAKNAAVGGAQGSQHMKNLAIDVAGKGLDDATKQAIVDAALSGGARGIGYYPKSDSFHFDLRTGAPAAWGQNTSHTSLGGTPTWFQDRAEALRSGKVFTSAATDGTGGDSVSTADPSGPGAGPAPEEPGFSAGFDQALAETQAQQAAQAAQPLPPPLEPPKPLVAEPTPGLNPDDQVQAADLMTSLLDRKRQQRLGMPQGVLSAWG